MNNLINEMLIILILIILYFCVIKYKNTNNQNNMENINYIDNTEKFNNNQQFEIITHKNDNNDKILFDYELSKPDINEFTFNNGIIYGNQYIEKIDDDGKPIYKTMRNMENFYETKARFNYNYDDPKLYKMDSVNDPTLFFKNSKGKTIREIYDSSFTDYKSLTPKKKLIESEPNTTKLDGASNLSVLLYDNWIYDNEKPENGGLIKEGLYAFDDTLLNSNALY